MSIYLRVIEKNLNIFKNANLIDQFDPVIVYDDEITIDRKVNLYTVKDAIEHIDIEIKFNYNDDNYLLDSQERIPIQFHLDDANKSRNDCNYSIHLGNNVIHVSETLYKDDPVIIYAYSVIRTLSITAKVKIISTTVTK